MLELRVKALGSFGPHELPGNFFIRDLTTHHDSTAAQNEELGRSQEGKMLNTTFFLRLLETFHILGSERVVFYRKALYPRSSQALRLQKG